MGRYKELILNFAFSRNEFTRNELINYVSSNIEQNNINVTLSRMIKKGEIIRVTRGKYQLPASKSTFKPVIEENEIKIAEILKEKLPFAKFCIYNGRSLSSLQHHLSENNVTYVETDKCVMDSAFNILKDCGYTVWVSPTIDIFNRYINLSDNIVIIKPLTTESPLCIVHNVVCPTIEKILVDIQKDDVFYYLHGAEAERMWEIAHSLYNINPSRLKRYARRRGLNLTNYDKQIVFYNGVD